MLLCLFAHFTHHKRRAGPRFPEDGLHRIGQFVRAAGIVDQYLAVLGHAAKYGVKGKWIARDGDAVIEALEAGKPVIAHMASGLFAKSGHYTVLRGVTEDGKILVNDPGSAAKNKLAYPLKTILREARTSSPFMVCEVT